MWQEHHQLGMIFSQGTGIGAQAASPPQTMMRKTQFPGHLTSRGVLQFTGGSGASVSSWPAAPSITPAQLLLDFKADVILIYIHHN